MINEFLILTMTINLLLFTDFASDSAFQYDVAGWSYVCVLALCIAFNLSLLFRGSIRYLRLVIKKYYRRLDRHIEIAKTAKMTIDGTYNSDMQLKEGKEDLVKAEEQEGEEEV